MKPADALREFESQFVAPRPVLRNAADLLDACETYLRSGASELVVGRTTNRDALLARLRGESA